LVYRTQDEPDEFEKLRHRFPNVDERNKQGVQLIIQNFVKLLEQSKALEDEVEESRVFQSQV
jgi:hypothetical protein